MRHISEDARRHSPLALKTLIEICSAGRSEFARIAAAREILLRAWGAADGRTTSVKVDPTALQQAAERILAKRAAIPGQLEAKPTLGLAAPVDLLKVGAK